jgi:hypothetical protein
MPGLFPTAYFPPAGYMAEVIRTNCLIIEAWETYLKQTCRNHCLIAGPNGIQILSIPVSKPDGNHTLTRDIRISGHLDWQKNHWRSIETAYNSSPFFLYYRDRFLPFFEKRYTHLLDVNLAIMTELLRLLKVDIPIQRTQSFEKKIKGTLDFRDHFGIKHPTTPLLCPTYTQVFSPKNGFLPNLSMLDLVFNLGPETRQYLEGIKT